MPALLGWLIGICGTLAGRVLVALGIGYLSFKGLDAGIAAMKADFYQHCSILGGTIVGLLGMLHVDECVNMVCSAMVGRLVVNGMTSGVIKKMVIK